MQDNIRSKLARVSKLNEEARAAAAERYLEASRQRLFKIMSKKLKTSFIGALAQFESHFGFLWGHGLRDEDCTPEQLEWRDDWEKARTEVLNVGNTQLRAVESELSEYTVSWNGYHLTLVVTPPASEGQEEQ